MLIRTWSEKKKEPTGPLLVFERRLFLLIHQLPTECLSAGLLSGHFRRLAVGIKLFIVGIKDKDKHEEDLSVLRKACKLAAVFMTISSCSL
jgi:hypothetical protein